MKEEEERTPLRTILQNFLNHIEKLDKEKLEGSYDKEFQELKLFSEFLKTSKQYSCSQGEKEVNRKKNRYKDILPFDCSRVILEDYAGIPGSDYINANYIKGASGSPAYIASQGPLPHTVNDFWRMVVQCEVQVIVMACNEEEAGKHKCENYWVEREGEEKQFGMVAIQLMKASVVCPDFLVRTMRLKYTKNHSTTQEERTVCQFHYSAWPDHGVPPLVRPLLDMVRLVRDTQASETLPVLVHCSAGCGRTGTICAIDYVWGLLRAGKLTRDFSLFKLVREMRKQRIAMVQTKEQYILVHHAVKELFNEQLRMIDSHPYENIDVNGMVKESPEPEPLYATITPEIYSEEKQDSNEKDVVCTEVDDAPPLPCKRKPYTAHTKQEKEVENLSQKHRNTVSEHLPSSGSSSPGPSSSNSSSISGSLLHKPRIAKLRALFERTSNRDSKSVQVKQRSPQQVTRSHSLGAVRKLEDSEVCVQPIPNKGILRVPQLSVSSDATYIRNGRPALPIKRSKSLKVLSSGERSKFSVPGIRGTFSSESQSKNPTEDELRYQESNSIMSIPGSDNFVREEVKPLVPPKKVPKDKVSERKASKSPSGTRKLMNAPNVSSSSKKIPEIQTINPQLSSMDCWKRRSLDSLPFESELTAATIHPSGSRGLASSKGQVVCGLDDEAKKLFQDCRDYLNEKSNCESKDVLITSEKRVPSTQGDALKNIAVEAQRKVHAVVVGLGIRERRNSFRQAISKDTESSRRASGYESLWPSGAKEKSTDHSKMSIETQPAFIDKTQIDPSNSRKKCFAKTGGQSLPMQVQQSSARAFRSGKIAVSQKTEQPSSSLYPKSTLDLRRGTCVSGTESFQCQNKRPVQALLTNSKEGHLESKRGQQLNVPANTSAQQSNEPVYLKGNVDHSRHDPRSSVSIPISVHPKVHNLCLPGSLGSTEDAASSSERRIPGHSFSAAQNSDTKDSKSMNVPLARRVNTAFKGRYMVSASGSTKHPDRLRIGDSEIPSMMRNIYSEDTRNPQPLLEASHPTGVVSDTSIIDEANSPSQANCKGQGNPSVSMMLESNKASKYTERVEVGSGAVRRVNLLPVPANVTGGSQANGPHAIMQRKPDHRFWVMDPGIGCVRVFPGVEQETSVPIPEGGERSVPSTKPGSRVVPKMNLKQKDTKVSENSSFSNSVSNNPKVSRQEMEAWIGAPGIDVDMVGASIKPSRDHGTPLARALEAFHFRKSSRTGAVSPPQQRKATQPQVFVKKQHYL